MRARGASIIERIHQRDTWCPRTFAILGHRSAGKTSLGDLLLQAARVTRQVGSVEEGTSLLDASAEARRHRQTLAIGSAWLEHDGSELLLVDTPGTSSLSHESQRAAHATSACVVAVDAGQGVELGTEHALRWAEGRPTLVVVTKLERLGALDELIGEIEQGLGGSNAVRVVPLQLPLWDDSGGLQGLVDVVSGQVLRYATDGSGAMSPEPVPRPLRPALAAARERLAESVALTDDVLLERYLEDLGLPDDVVDQGLISAVQAGRLVPLMLTSAGRRIGAIPLLDTLARLVPSAWARPEGCVPRVCTADGEIRAVAASDGFVGEVVAVQRHAQGECLNVVRVCAGTAERGSWTVQSPRAAMGPRPATVRVDKLYRMRGPRRATVRRAGPGAWVVLRGEQGLAPGDTLTRGAALQVVAPTPPTGQLVRWVRPEPGDASWEDAVRAVVAADAGLQLHSDPSSGASLLSATSEGHLRLALERVEALGARRPTVALPPVAYREMPTRAVEGIEGVHEARGDGGLVSEYGRCVLALQPTSHEQAPTVVDQLPADDEDLPRRFRPALSEGAQDAFQHGPTAGYPVVGVEIRLTGGDYDILESTDAHFRLAAHKAVRLALEASGTQLLEPWKEVTVVVPEDSLRALLSDVASHRGRIVDIRVDGGEAEVVAHCPYRELRTFGGRLDGLTSGRGTFQCRDSHYDVVPSHLVAEAIETSQHT
ncbi:MAG: 50S ribosome-binding GTPase [Myxococcales bacterium]|nr:50S ribosome-binding GTPase [Myxococcales bacterium]